MKDFIQKISLLSKEILEAHPILYDKISKALGTNRETVLPAMIEVLRFLYLINLSDTVLTPSHKVDLAWHEFILFTRAYHHFCKNQFGRYVHHNPGGFDDLNRTQYAKTLLLYQEHFGDPPTLFWGKRDVKLDPENCGTCESN